MARKLGIATMGQAPRDDLVALFGAHAPAGTEVILRGCLDGVSESEIDARRPLNGDDTLYTRFRGDKDVTISKKHVIEHAPATLARLRADGADAVVFACTGDFPPMNGDAGVLFPSRVLDGWISALLPTGRLGLLVPLAEQIPKLAAKRRRPGLEVVAEPLVPSGDPAAARLAAERLKALKPDVVAMDCMGYSQATKDIVAAIVGVPVLLAVTTVSRVVEEVLDR